jgi:iron complex outermembrane receptor protein
LGYDITRNLSLNIGAANLLNVYPTQQDTETETGGLWDAVQVGFSGTFYFTRLGFKF